MSAVRRFFLRAFSFFRSRRAEADLAREITAHLQLLEDKFAAQGMSPNDARDAARRAFGGVEQAKERQRDSRSFRWLDESWLDLKLGARMLIKYPGLTLVGSLGMAVSIAIGGSFFTILYGYVQPRLPLDEGDRVIAIQNWDTSTNDDEPRSLHDFVSWRDELQSVEEIGAFRTLARNLVIPGGSTTPVATAEITASAFRLARVPPRVGRPLIEDDERDGAPPVVVIGYEIWRTAFASDPAVIGRSVRLGNAVFTIVGVMPEHFAFPVKHRAWVPFQLKPSDFERRQGPSIGIFARLKAGVTLDEAQAELTAVGHRTATAFPATHERLQPRIVPYTALYATLSDDGLARWQIHLIQWLVSMLLVIVCANVAILIYARTATRMREIAMRTALGASRRRIVGQLFVEALVLALVAAVLGLALANVAMQQVDALLATGGDLPFWIEPGLSLGAVVYVVALTVLAAIIAGVVPALQATGRRYAVLQQLGASAAMRLGTTWTALIVVQVAFAVAILPPVIYAGSELIAYAAIEPGFPAAEFLSVRLAMDRDTPPTMNVERYEREFTARYGDRQLELINRLKAEPAVSGATFAWTIPGAEPTVWIEIEGLAMPPEFSSGYAVRSGAGGHEVRFGRVDVDYFNVFNVPILAGRVFTASDLASAPTAVIVNRSFAHHLLHDENAVGRRMRYVGRSGDARPEDVDFGRWYEVVGVVADFPPNSMEPGQAAARVYHPLAPGQVHPTSLALHLRGTDTATFAPRLREITTTLDPTLRLDEVFPLDVVMRECAVVLGSGHLRDDVVHHYPAPKRDRHSYCAWCRPAPHPRENLLARHRAARDRAHRWRGDGSASPSSR
jgi:putative ABC transport system permease protein